MWMLGKPLKKIIEFARPPKGNELRQLARKTHHGSVARPFPGALARGEVGWGGAGLPLGVKARLGIRGMEGPGADAMARQ